MPRTILSLLVLLFAALVSDAAEATVAGRTLKDWIADLDSKDALVREEAADVLPEFGREAQAAIPKLQQLYQADAPSVRFRAAMAIWRIEGRTEPALAVLTAAVKEARGSRRLQAVHLLQQLGRPVGELAPVLVDIVLKDHHDYTISYAVISSLAQYGDEAMPALRDALGRARGEQRMQLLTVIQSLGSTARSLLPAIQSLRAETDPRLRVAATRTAFVLDPQNREPLAALVQQSRSSDATARREAFQAAMTLQPRPKELVPLYREFLKDTDSNTRCSAAAALVEADPTALNEALPIPRKVLEEGQPHLWTPAVYAIGRMGPAAKEAIPDLTKLLQRPDGRNYSYMIVQALGHLGPEGIPPLLEILADPQEIYRTNAQQALLLIGPEGIPKMVAGLEHKSPVVRQTILQTLAQFGPGARAAAKAIGQRLKDGEAVNAGGPGMPIVAAAPIAPGMPVAQPLGASVRDRALTTLIELGPDAKEAAPAVVELIRDGKQNDGIRARALEVLAAIGPGANSHQSDIAEFLKSSNSLVRFRAAAAVAAMDPTRRAELLPALTAPLHERSMPAGLAPSLIIQVLARLEAPAPLVMKAVQAFLANPSPDAQYVAAALNTHYPDEAEAIPALRGLWKTSQLPVQQEAAIGLSRRNDLAEEVVPFLAEQVRIHSSAGRARYLTAIEDYGAKGREAVPSLVNVWRGEANLEGRFRLAETILRVDPQQTAVRDWLRAQFHTNASTVSRQQAARALASVDPQFESLRAALERWTRDPNVTTSVVGLEIIGLLGEHGKALTPLLRERLSDVHPLKRVRAAHSLWKIEKSSEAIVPVLTAALSERDPPAVLVSNSPVNYLPSVTAPRSAAGQAAQALGEIGSAARSALPALRAAQLSPDQGLRTAATAAIRKIEATGPSMP